VHPTVDASAAAYQQAEVAGLQLGTTFSNEYLPRQVYALADPTPRLLDDYADGYPINRVHLENLPQGASVEVLEHGPQYDTWRVTSDTAFTMEVLIFYFPGWQVLINDEPVDITPADQHGFITFPVPAGTHTVRMFLGSTPARGIGGWLTLGAAAALASVVWRSRRRLTTEAQRTPKKELESPRNHAKYDRERRDHEKLGALPYSAVVAAAVLMLALCAVFLREGGAWVQSPPGAAVIAQHTLDYRLGEHTYIIGYDLSDTTFRAGERVELVLYWYAEQPAPYKYIPFVHIGTLGAPPLTQAPGKDHPGGRPMTEWTADGYIRDAHVIFLPADMPAGEYQIIVGLYTCETRPAGECGNGERPTVYDADGNVVGDVAVVATITVSN
jgi:hypothetical protein